MSAAVDSILPIQDFTFHWALYIWLDYPFQTGPFVGSSTNAVRHEECSAPRKIPLLKYPGTVPRGQHCVYGLADKRDIIAIEKVPLGELAGMYGTAIIPSGGRGGRVEKDSPPVESSAPAAAITRVALWFWPPMSFDFLAQYSALSCIMQRMPIQRFRMAMPCARYTASRKVIGRVSKGMSVRCF